MGLRYNHERPARDAAVSNILSLVRGEPSKESALRVLDALRASIESGEVKAFAVVGIAPDDETLMWTAQVHKTTRLQMLGAMHHLLHRYECGD